MKWFVLYTKPNFELKVTEGINTLGINAYCPTFTQIKHYSDRKKKVQKPLLPSYVLVQLSEEDRPKVFSIPGVVRYLFWLGKPAIVRDEEITTIKNWLSTPDKCDVSVAAFQIGDKITLESGPFITQEATVQEIKNNHYVLVLESLGCTLKMNFK